MTIFVLSHLSRKFPYIITMWTQHFVITFCEQKLLMACWFYFLYFKNCVFSTWHQYKCSNAASRVRKIAGNVSRFFGGGGGGG
jgi:hypothetical protein